MVESLHGMQSLFSTCSYLDLSSCFILTERKDEFMELHKVSIYMASYEAKFYPLSIYPKQLVTMKQEKIWLFRRSLDFKLQMLSVHITSVGRSFNEVTNYVVKVDGVKQDGQSKGCLRWPRILEHFRPPMLEDRLTYTRGHANSVYWLTYWNSFE